VLLASYYDRVGSYDGVLVAMSALVLACAVLVFFARTPARPERSPDETVATAGPV
jgi:hypothetical protein